MVSGKSCLPYSHKLGILPVPLIHRTLGRFKCNLSHHVTTTLLTSLSF